MAYVAPSGISFGPPAVASRRPEARAAIILADLPALLWRRRRSIVGATLATLLLAIVFSVLVRPSYLSTTRLLIDPRGLQVMDRELTPAGPGGDLNLAVVESQMRVLTSDSVLKLVAEKLNLLDDPEFARRKGIIGSMLWGQSTNDPALAVLAELRKAIRAERLQTSFIVDLSVATRDGEKSARLANEIAAVYMNSEFANRENLAMRASDALAGRLEELKSKVRSAEEAVERYKQDNNIFISGGSLFSDQELAQLNQQLAQVKTQAAQAQARAEQIERVLSTGASPDSIAEAVQSQTIMQLRVRLSLAQQQVAALAVDMKPAHPQMQAARARALDAANQIRSELDRIASAARADLERAQASERDLVASLDKAKRERGGTDQARVQLRELERDADASRAIYESFLVRARELGAQKVVDLTNARVLSPAVAPPDPRGLRPSVLLPLSILAGLGLGFVLALTREQLDPIVRSRRDVEDVAGQRVLSEFAYPGADANSLLPLVAKTPQHPSAVAMRQLRASLASSPAIGGPRSVLVTATGEQDGKSAVALNLALAGGLGGERVLLIDGDAVRHKLTTLRVGDKPGGLADVIQNRLSIENASIADPSGLISILPSARAGQKPARLAEADLARLLAEKCAGFDLVVIDGGLIGIDASTNAFAAAVDDIVTVVRCDATRKDEVAASITKLGPCTGKMRGIVLVTPEETSRRAWLFAW